jgi:hypothetical protein
MGGTIAIGERVRVRFRVVVDALDAPATLTNTAHLTFRGAAMGTGGAVIDRESSGTGGAGATTIDAVPCTTTGSGCEPGSDAGAADAGAPDGGSTPDAGARDSGSPGRDGGGAGADSGGATTGGSDDGGCGCRVPGDGPASRTAPLALAAAAALFGVAWARSRRRARRSR